MHHHVRQFMILEVRSLGESLGIAKATSTLAKTALCLSTFWKLPAFLGLANPALMGVGLSVSGKRTI